MTILIGSTGGGGGSRSVSTVSAIATDMFFGSNSARDIWTSGNPDRLVQGIACAVGSGSTYSYYMWDQQAGQWRDADLIYQGPQGEKGEQGPSGSSESIVEASMDIVLGMISTTLTKENGNTVSSIPVVLPESDEIKSVENTFLDNELITKITTEAGKQFSSAGVLIESGEINVNLTQAQHELSSNKLKTIYTLSDNSVIESNEIELPSSGGGEGLYLKSASHDIFNNALQTTYTLSDDSTVKSNAIELPRNDFVIDAPDNTLVKIVGGELVAAEVVEDEGVVKTAPASVQIGAHKISSIGDSIGVQNQATDQQRILLYQDITGGVTQRPYVYKMRNDDWSMMQNINEKTAPVIKESQQIVDIVGSGYYIIKPDSIIFELDENITDFKFTIFDNVEKIFEQKYAIAGNEKLLSHGAIVIDGVADISFSVTDLEGNPIAVLGSEILNAQRFAFTIREAERAYLAYENEGGSGGEYPKNPTFETVITETFAGLNANRFVSFLTEKVAIESDTSIDLKIEGADAVTIDKDEINAGFKEIVDIQGGSKPSSAVNLAQVESMLKNLFLQRVDVTLQDNQLRLGQEYAGKNVFVFGSGLESKIQLNAEDFTNYQVIQLTRSSEYTNVALPVILVEEDREIRYLVQGTTSFGIYDGRWIVLSDATVTLAEVDQRAAFQQYVIIKAGQGMTSRVDSFGTMTLDVVSSGGDSSVEVDDDYLLIAKNKVPVQSAFYQELNRLVLDGGAVVGGHVLESAGEALNSNDHALVTQGVNSLYEYQRPKIYVETLASDTHFTVNQTNQSYAKPEGQQVNVSADYSHLRIHPETLHFQPNQVGSGYKFVIKDQHEQVIFVHESNQSFSAISTVHVEVPIINLRCNSDYHFFVYDLSGAPLLLKGSGGIQKFGFDFQYLDQADLVIQDDIVLPDSPTFEHVQTLRVSDLTNSAGLAFNSAGFIETDCNVSLDGHQLISVGDATSTHHAPNLGQVNHLIASAEFVQAIDIDGQSVDALQLDEDTFSYTYDPVTRVMNLSVIGQHGGGGGDGGGTVYPIIIDPDAMDGYLCEFGSRDGNVIRSSGTKVQVLNDAVDNANQLANKAHKAAIGADATAGTALAATTANSGVLTRHQIEIDRVKIQVNTNSGSITRTSKSMVQNRNELTALKKRVDSHEVALRQVDDWIIQTDQRLLKTDENIQTLDSNSQKHAFEIQALVDLGLEEIAKGEFVERLIVSDNAHNTRIRSIINKFGCEIEYALPPEQRTTEPSYSITITADGQSHEALKLTTSAIKANMKPIKELAEGVDPNDAVTVGQVKEYLQQIADRLDVIEAELGIAIPPSVFPVYSGRITTNATSDQEVIKNCGHVEENVTAETLLFAPGEHLYKVQAHDPEAENPTFSMIAYPKNVLTPNPMRVRYSNFVADWLSFEIIIDGVRYIVLINSMPDTNPNINHLELVQ
ncbi:MAG: hypothetical protein CME61_09480 [Halobacteriovoraceae bacterium]|nr:hypothetical protein [Halobacteriovoraceae bacterium]